MIHSITPGVQSGASARLEFQKKRLLKACDEFGALLTQQLLKSMREGTIRAEQPGQSQQIYESMFDQQLALEVSKHQNGGISSLLYQQLLPLVTGQAQQKPAQESSLNHNDP